MWGTEGRAYAIIEAEKGVITENVEEGGKHAFRAIGGAGLEADLLVVSKLCGVVSVDDVP